jgi:hypothetical protein
VSSNLYVKIEPETTSDMITILEDSKRRATLVIQNKKIEVPLVCYLAINLRNMKPILG